MAIQIRYSSVKTRIQLVIVVLLVIAIALQVSMRKRSWLHSLSSQSVSNVQSKHLDGFMVQQQQQSYGTITNTNPSMAMPVTEGLWCIDMVRRCTRFKSETRPKMQKSPPLELEPSLAMAVPVLKGGYRSQYMRFVALVAMALSANQTILLESVKWNVRSSNNAIPFQMLFDVDTWNANRNLPKLVSYSPKKHPQWNPKSTVFIGSCPTVVSWFQSSQYVTFVPELVNMTAPYPGGGARPNQPGNLWDYYRKHDKYGLMIQHKKQGTSISLPQLEEWMLTSMKPSQMVQGLVDSLKPADNNNDNNNNYIALHPRIEPEFLKYRYCQAGKVRRLHDMIQQITNYPAFAQQQQKQQLFVAVAMPQMQERQKAGEPWYKDHAENLKLLQSLLEHGLTKNGDAAQQQEQKMHVWTAGEAALEHRINHCTLPLVASMVNMELACQAHVFIGTRVSAWSMSVWKIRHHRGLANNYEFTPTGIQVIDGLPPPFKC